MDGPVTMHLLPDAVRTRALSTDELRSAFLVQGLFRPGVVTLRHVDLDRVVLGGAVPLVDPLVIEAPASLAAAFLCERREAGILNTGGAGSVVVDGIRYPMSARDVLYVGRGSRDVSLASDAAATPARFYVVSYPAHASHPCVLVPRADAAVTELGVPEAANRRRLAKYIRPGAVASAQLVMGVTELAPGSVWNTMPPHTHLRRTETYLYFGLPGEAAVVHLMGEPAETRHLLVRDSEVVLSPAWSIHCGAGTTNYAFCWAMGGENQDFADMQAADIHLLK